MFQTKLLATTLGVGVVYACMWAMFYAGSYSGSAGDHHNVSSFAALITLCIQIFFFLLFTFIKRAPASLLASCATLCAALLALYHFACPTDPKQSTLLLCATSFAFGMFRPLIIICWFDQMSSMEYREAQSCVASAICLASSLTLFLMVANQLVAKTVISILPIASVAAYLWVRGRADGDEPSAGTSIERYREVVLSAKTIPVSLLLEVLVVSVANGYIRGINVFSEVEGSILVFSAVCICCAVVPFSKTLKPIYSVSTVLVTVGLIMLAISDGIGCSLIAFGQIGISVIAWIACVAIAKKHSIRAGIVGGLTWTVLTFGQTLGNGFGMIVARSQDAAPALGAAAPAVIGILSIVLLALTINKPFLSIIHDEERSLRTDAEFASRVASMVSQYHLTARETEVFEMLAQGRNAKYITDRLGISPNTTKTHIRNIYIKIGVDSHQELLTRLEDCGR